MDFCAFLFAGFWAHCTESDTKLGAIYGYWMRLLNEQIQSQDMGLPTNFILPLAIVSLWKCLGLGCANTSSWIREWVTENNWPGMREGGMLEEDGVECMLIPVSYWALLMTQRIPASHRTCSVNICRKIKLSTLKGALGQEQHVWGKSSCPHGIIPGGWG